MDTTHTISAQSAGPRAAYQECNWEGIRSFLRTLLLFQLVLSPVVFFFQTLESFAPWKAALLYLQALLVTCAVPMVFSNTSWSQILRFTKNQLRNPICVSILFCLVSAGISTVLSTNYRISFWGGNNSHGGLVTALSLTLLFFTTRIVFNDQFVRQAFIALLGGALLASVYGLIQFLSCDPIPWGLRIYYHGWCRPGGTMGHPNHLAGLLAMIFPLLFYLWKTTQEPQKKWSFLNVGLLGVLLVIVSFSRGAWVATLVPMLGMILCWIFWEYPAQRKKVVCVGLVFAGMLFLVSVICWRFLPPDLRDRVKNIGEMNSRIAMWEAAWNIFCRYPLVGTGTDTFEITFPLFRTPVFELVEKDHLPTRAHNEILNLLATQGAIGGLASIALLMSFIWATVKSWKEKWHPYLVLAVTGALISYYLQNLVSFAAITTQIVFVVLAAILSRVFDKSNLRVIDTESEPLWLSQNNMLILSGSFLFLTLLCNQSYDHPEHLLVALVLLFGAILLGCSFTGSSVRRICPSIFWGRRTPSWLFVGCVGLFVFFSWYGIGARLVAGYFCRGGSLVSSYTTSLQRHQLAVQLAPEWDVMYVELASHLSYLAGISKEAAEKTRLLNDAVDAMATACRLTPTSATHRANYARMLTALAESGVGCAGDAMKQFAAAVELDPCDTTCLLDAARAAFLFQEMQKGREYLKRARVINEKNPALFVEQGALAIRERRYNDAVADLQNALLFTPTDAIQLRLRIWSLLSYSYLELHMPGAAIEMARFVLHLDPTNRSAFWICARSLEMLGQKSEALSYLRRYEELCSQIQK